jgi:hypothetical protein
MAVERTEVRTRRVSPLLIVMLAVLVLALLWFFVITPLVFQDDEVIETPPAARPAGAAPTPAPEEAPAEPPAETFEVFESKDPFRPLVTEAAPTTGSGNGTAGTGGSTSGGTTNGSTGAGGAPAPSGGQRVSLLDILEDQGETKAQVKVGSTVYTVAPGEVFADNFKAVSISGNCATMLHGDDKFTLCEGEEVIK